LDLVSASVGKKSSFKGILYEAVLRKTLRDLLPNRLEVGTGFLVDLAQGKLSAQCDIILYTDSHIAPVYQYQDFVVIDHRTAYAVIEVKSTLDKKVIKRAGSNLQKLRESLPLEGKWFLTAAGSRISQNKVKQHSDEFLVGCSGVLVLEDNKSGKAYYLEGKVYESAPFTQFLKSILEPTMLVKPSASWLFSLADSDFHDE
jgi:hypothetical protein